MLSMEKRGSRLNRRSFFGCLAVPIVELGVSGFPHSSVSKRRIPVGAHPWVYAATLPGHDIFPVLDTIFADMSYARLDGIELMHTALRPANAVERIGELSQRNGLPVIGTSFEGPMWDRSRNAGVVKDAELIIPRLARLGGRTVGTSVGSAGRRKTEDELDAQVEVLRRMMSICEVYGVELNLHNHTYEVEDNQHDLQGTLSRLPDVKLGPDLNWLVRGGVDPVEFLLAHRDRIVFLHLRDQKADGRWSEALGEGDMDFRAIGRALREIGFSGTAIIELAHESGFQPTRPLRESLKMSRHHVRETLGF
jgi:sugar phosphate isomerase/epimerase